MSLSQTSAPAYFTIWRDSSQPPYQSIVWTLTGIQSLALLAFLGVCITFTQPSWWIITRYLLVRILRSPVQLPDVDEASSLHKLSQIEAIRALIFNDRGRSNQHLTYISPLFGLASLVTAVLFMILGVITPYFLTSGSGPATVQSQGAQECDGLYTYTPTSMHLAKAFYTQCQNIDDCTYPAKIAPSRNTISTSTHDECPFSEFSCANFISPKSKDFGPQSKLDALHTRPNRAIRIEYLDSLPSDYGLNTDRNMRISHRVTCAPIKVKQVQVDKIELGRNATVFWVGYPPWQINETETWPAVGETRKYFTNDSISNSINLGPVTVTTTTNTNRGPFKLKSGMVYDAIVNSAYDYPRAVYENFHPGLNRHDGDMFIVMYQYSVDLFSTPIYGEWPEELLRLLRDDLNKTVSLTTTAIACVEQYRSCFHTACTEWDNAANTIENMKWFLKREHQNNSLETFRPEAMLIKASSLRYYLQRNHRSTMLFRSILRPNISQVALLAAQQWQFEVRTWFDLAFLTTKFSVLKSGEGDKTFLPRDYFYYFPNTSWICDKVLLVDENYTNVNFIGFMATLGALTSIFLLSRVDRLILSTKNGVSRWQKAWQTTRKQSKERLQTLRCHFIAVKAFIQSNFKRFWPPLTLRQVPSFWSSRSRNIDDCDSTDDHERISLDRVNAEAHL